MEKGRFIEGRRERKGVDSVWGLGQRLIGWVT